MLGGIMSCRSVMHFSALFCVSLAFMSALTGCTPLRVEPPSIIRGLPPDEAIKDSVRVADLAVRNQAAEDYYQLVERPLQVDPNQPSYLGIALSGGGMRSAVFSLGVLSGLHEMEIFPHRTDLLSAVSGGGYIASWFYAQQVIYNSSPDALLDPKGAAQNHLQAHGDFVEIKPRHPGSYVAATTTLVPMAAVNLLANGVFGWHANTPVTSPYYKYRFQKTFFSADCGRENTPSVSWRQIREKISEANKNPDRARHIPNFILNTTVALGYHESDVARRGFNAVYEFTPQRFGSEGMGYYCYTDSLNAALPKPKDCKDWSSPELGPLERIAVTSGAAFDSSVVPGRLERMIASVANFDLGHFFPNPNAASGHSWQLALPFPFYTFTKQYRLDSKGRRMLLTDGGHSDNLGVYSLIRRAPAHIIVVDAEQDPEHKFEGYRKLRRMLLDDLNVVFSIPKIDDGNPGPGPVYFGTVGTFPRGDGSVMDIQVFYIKLPLRDFVKSQCDEKLETPVPDTVCNYIRCNDKFPFDGTTNDQSYDAKQFAAYRDLGLWVVTSTAPIWNPGVNAHEKPSRSASED